MALMKTPPARNVDFCLLIPSKHEEINRHLYRDDTAACIQKIKKKLVPTYLISVFVVEFSSCEPTKSGYCKLNCPHKEKQTNMRNKVGS